MRALGSISASFSPIETLSATSLKRRANGKHFSYNNLRQTPSFTLPTPTIRDQKQQRQPLFNSHRVLTGDFVRNHENAILVNTLVTNQATLEQRFVSF